MLTAAIVGAGVGGLALAAGLARRGAAVTVYEQAPELGEVGAGLQLSPNAMHALADLGLGAEVEAIGFEPEQAEMRHWKSGATLFASPLKSACRRRYGAPYLHVHRADLHGVLARAARAAGAHIRLDHPIDGYRQTSGGPRLIGADDAAFDLIIGADGVKSPIRAAMLGPERPRFTGQVAWRALIPAEDAPGGLIPPNATVWIGPARHAVTYYVRGGAFINLVAVEERADWTSEDWTETGDPAELIGAFGDWHPAIAALVRAARETHLWALIDRPELPRWSDGAVGLLGDACHPTLPFMAQGAAMAVEDACVLIRCLTAASDVPAALTRYEALRKPRATMLQAKARENARLFHLNGGVRDLVNRAKLMAGTMLPGALALTPLDRVYGYDPTKARP